MPFCNLMFISKQEFSIPRQMWNNICQTIKALCSKVWWRSASTNQVEKQYMYEPTQNIHSCIRWAESKFSKLSWPQYSLCTFHFQRVWWDEAKWEEPALCSSNLKNKLFLEKKKNSNQIFTVSHKLQISDGAHKNDPVLGLHCCQCLDPPTSSQSHQTVGEETWGKGRLGQREPHTSNRN